jgi:hypothetical protein
MIFFFALLSTKGKVAAFAYIYINQKTRQKGGVRCLSFWCGAIKKRRVIVAALCYF